MFKQNQTCLMRRTEEEQNRNQENIVWARSVQAERKFYLIVM